MNLLMAHSQLLWRIEIFYSMNEQIQILAADANTNQHTMCALCIGIEANYLIEVSTILIMV